MQSTRVPADLLYLCGPQIRGYSFKIKKWGRFSFTSMSGKFKADYV